jgi:Glycosyl hydrolase family 26
MTLLCGTSPTLTRSRGALLALTISVTVALSGVAVSPAQAYTAWQSGVYTGTCGEAAQNPFGAWRQAKIERTAGYVSADTWDDLTTLSTLGTCLSNAGVPISLSVAMLPANSGATLRVGASGAYNTYWTTFGTNAVQDGYANATLRIGWEMNGDWFNWSAINDPIHWKLYWRQIVTTLRQVPGQHFTFDWSPGLGRISDHFDASRAYPGDAYVTYVGSSVYDEYWGYRSASAAKRWNNMVQQRNGLAWLAAFAKRHHKKIGISEWALATKDSFDGHGDGDNAYFVTHFYAWMKKSNVAYDIYFNRLHQDNEHRLSIGTQTNSAFTKAGAAYQRTFGGLGSRSSP